MKIVDLLTSPPPATGWSLDGSLAAVVRRQSKAELRCAAVEIPEETFDVGPVVCRRWILTSFVRS